MHKLHTHKYSSKWGLFTLAAVWISLTALSTSIAQNQPVSDEDMELNGDFAFAQMQYNKAVQHYESMAMPTPSAQLKQGLSYLFMNELDKAENIFSGGEALIRSDLGLEARFYELSTRLARAFESSDYLFQYPAQSLFAKETLTALFNNESTPIAALQLIIKQLVDYHAYSSEVASGSARIGLSELIELFLPQLPVDDPVDKARKLSVIVLFHYANQNFGRVFEHAGPLLVQEEFFNDEFVAEGVKAIAYALAEHERELVALGTLASSTWSPHAAQARQIGLKVLKRNPTDQAFADWLGMEVIVNLFLQTRNPAYLIEAVQLASPTTTQLKELSDISRHLLGKSLNRDLITKDDASLIESVFSSPHRAHALSLRLFDDEDLTVVSLLHGSERALSPINDGFARAGTVPYMAGGAIVLGRLNRDTFPHWMLHNRPGAQPPVLHHQWLSNKLFGNRMVQVHSLLDSYGKGTGYYHRMLGGHNIGWVVRNLRTLANMHIPNVGRLGYARATGIWLQHMVQDSFGPKGIPSPIITRTTYFASKTYAKAALGLSDTKARTYALRTASKTCLTFAKIGKAANVALWAWIAYDVYNAVEDYQADATLQDMGMEVSKAIEYGDMGLACEKLRRTLDSRRVRRRSPAEAFAMRLTLARMYNLADSPERAKEQIVRVLNDCAQIEFAMDKRVEPDESSDADYQRKKLDKVSRDIGIVLVNDSTFNAMVAARGLAHEINLSTLPDAHVSSSLDEAVGIFHRAGDALANSRKGNDIEVSWASAVNYYRAARLAVAYQHADAVNISTKAVNQLYDLLKFAGPITRPLLLDLIANWCIEILPNGLRDVMRVDLSKFDNTNDLSWHQLRLHSITIDQPLMSNPGSIRVELVRQISEDIQQVIFTSDTREARPGVECVSMNSCVFAIHPNDQYIMRIYQSRSIGRDTLIYDSSLHSSFQSKGRPGLFESMRSQADLSIRASLKPANTYLVTLAEFELSDLAISRLTGRLGNAGIYVDGQLNARITAQSAESIKHGESGWGLYFGTNQDPGIRVLGGVPAVVVAPQSSCVRLQFASYPNIRSRLEPLAYPWFSTFIGDIFDAQHPEDIVSFDIIDAESLADLSAGERLAVLRTINGDVLRLSVKRFQIQINME